MLHTFPLSKVPPLQSQGPLALACYTYWLWLSQLRVSHCICVTIPGLESPSKKVWLWASRLHIAVGDIPLYKLHLHMPILIVYPYQVLCLLIQVRLHTIHLRAVATDSYRHNVQQLTIISCLLFDTGLASTS